MDKDLYLVLRDSYPCGCFNVTLEGGIIPEDVCSFNLKSKKRLAPLDPFVRMAHYSAREEIIKMADERGVSFADKTIYADS